MSTLSTKTELKVLSVLAACLPFFEELAHLQMTAEDAYTARGAENAIRRSSKALQVNKEMRLHYINLLT